MNARSLVTSVSSGVPTVKRSSMLIAAALAVLSLPSHAGWSSSPVSFGGLSAHVYTPDTKPAAGRMLIVNLHGCAQTNDELKKSNWDGVAEKYNAVVVLPKAGHPTMSVKCWNYGNPSVETNDYNSLVAGTKAFISDSKYGIDKNQVYMTGISSGASFAVAVGCSNPDLYAGVAAAAGPSIGSNQNNAITGEPVDIDKAVNYCKGLAKGKEEFFKTQLYAQTYGAELPKGDTICAPGYIEPNHKIFQKLLGLTGGASHEQDIPATNPTAGHTTVAENEHYINDSNGAKRIALIEIPGMGHAWPGGVPKNNGVVGAYVSKSFDFGEWLAVNFTKNNCRIAANAGNPICGTPRIPAVKDPFVCSTPAALTSVGATWVKPDADIDGYKAQVGTVIKTVSDPKVTFDGLKQGMTYDVTVWATKGTADGVARTIKCDTAGTPEPLPPPTGLNCTAPSSAAVKCTWNAVEGAKGYKVFRDESALATVAGTTYDDSAVKPQTSYQYKVATINKADVVGNQSSVALVTTPPAQLWDTKADGTCTQHYISNDTPKRFPNGVTDYLACGKKYGYMTSFTMYRCGNKTFWTDQSNCGPRSF